MKISKILFFTLAFLGLYTSSNAQSRLHLTDLYFMGGGSVTSAPNLNTWEINNLEKNLFSPSTLKPNATNQYAKLNARLNGHIGVMAGWTIKGTRMGQQKIRAGISAGVYSLNLNNYYQSKDSYRLDTLVSQQTGDSYYIDSTHTRTLSYEHLAQMLNFHLDYLVYINPGNKLTFYTGAGARFGISLNNSVSSDYYEYGSVDGFGQYEKEYQKYGKYQYNYNGYDNDSQTKTLSPATTLQAHAIVGLNYRLSKRNRFLKRIHLFHELNMGVQYSNMELIESNIGFNIGVQSGMRVSLFKKRATKKRATKKRTYERTRRKRY